MSIFNDTSIPAHFSYLGIFIWFAFLDQLAPIPEEVMLLSVGYVSGQHLLNPLLAGITAFTGLMIIDNLFYWLTRSGKKIIERFKAKISPRLMEEYEGKLRDHAGKTLFTLSFIPKVRFFSPILAGAFKVGWKKFFFVNALGTLIFATVYILLGMIFHKSLEHLIKKVEILRHSIFIISMIVLAGIVIFVVRKRHREKKEETV